jgi:ATP-dependent RNA helicase DeaD
VALALEAAHAPVELALALVRSHRARLPAPEELSETARAVRELPTAVRGRAAPRRQAPTDVVSFRILIGRERKADPKWILPLLCRRGGVSRDVIGKIHVLPRETQFEVARGAAASFARAAAQPDPRMPEARIERVRERPVGGAARPPRSAHPRRSGSRQ